MDLLIGAVARQHRVQGTFAFAAAEALLMPHRSLSELLLGGENCPTASRATLARCSLDGGCARDDKRPVR